jgi:hypothetical protein
MDSFSLIVLDDTLELAAEMMTSVQRVTDDVKVIRGYMNLIVSDPGNAPEYVVMLRQAIADLTDAANQNQQFFIAGRLENIARSLHRDRHAS